uniref:Tetraspanin n=1 Tax=Ciona savignyi TaxID=51511 RepID=H2Y5R7_CIOSA
MMFVFNVAILLCGCAVLGLGIWVVVDFSSFTATLNATSLLFQYASYVVIVVGSITIVMSFIGCVGAWKKNKCLLVTFAVIHMIFLLAEIAAIVMAFAFTSDLDRLLSDGATKTIKEDYGVTGGVGSSVTVAWDFAQTTLKCCGYHNGNDYIGSYYDVIVTHAQPWPNSCCDLNAAGSYVDVTSCTGPIFNAAHSNSDQGCSTSLKNIVREYAVVIGGVTIGVMMVQLLAVVFACCIASSVA